MPGLHLFENINHSIVETKLDCKRPLGYHSNSYSWQGKERPPPFGQTAPVCTGKQTNLGFSEGILPRQLEFSFFDGEVNVNFEWSTLCALGWRTTRDFPRRLFLYQVPSAAAQMAPNGVKERASFCLVFRSLNTTSSRRMFSMGYRRAKSTQGNTKFQKIIFWQTASGSLPAGLKAGPPPPPLRLFWSSLVVEP